MYDKRQKYNFLIKQSRKKSRRIILVQPLSPFPIFIIFADVFFMAGNQRIVWLSPHFHPKNPTMAKEITYTEAFEELQEIVHKMENADISVDELSDNIKKATQLIKICKDKLTKTEKEVNETIAELNA